MQFTTLTTLVFAATAMAKIHTYCRCNIDGKDNQALDKDACDAWSSVFPNSFWDPKFTACVDYHPHGGIDGQPGENQCIVTGTKAPYNLVAGAIRGSCWS
ncbi:hypothetical protein CB0940_05795 [Cercospora beticola]|uniref:Secreted protein n=1 Tax=Cercospora beticola TaxID=122368 RepID=A0A2G5HXY6_CERBT|nr:hypothetical protein CB0940_05795 [Cercospora beticola]PIA97386.1 hypothetical protein CB0940_05795 [Cercospora beticola]WPA98382.1 hypothetical protein RHO25_002994 [Cercospora beticola]CAK1359622.1 unnamed protein product [Cercospora beticola]